VGTGCGRCAACDGTGRCLATPTDDNGCGTITCGGLDTACRSYQDLTANRCASLGTCKVANDPATCTAYTDLPCADGGTAHEDGGQPGQDGGTTGNKSGGCSAARRTSSNGLVALLAVALLLGRRGRRR
jgi:hypothetical protein